MQTLISDYVHGLSSSEYQLQLLLLIILQVYILYKLYQTYQRFRFIIDTPTSKIVSAAQGYVELKGLGELLPGPVISSPFTHSRCIWYQCIVERRQKTKSHSGWVKESNEISDHLFRIEDETGSCIVIPDGAYVIPSSESVWYGSSHQAKHRGKVKTSWFNVSLGMGQYRFTEKLISVADSLYVAGLFQTARNTVQEHSLKQQENKLVDKWKQNPQRHLTEFDIDKNGKIQQQEWKLVRLKARQQIEQNNTARHTIKKPLEKNQPFVISTLLEEEILKKKRWRIMLYLALFFLILYVLLTALLSR